MISIIILAAGKSERMGKMKLLMPIDGGTVLEKTINNFALSGAGEEIIVVLGSHASELLEAIKSPGVKFVINEHYASGMSSSLVKGVRAISAKTDAVMIAMGDQPLIPAALIKNLANEFNKGPRGIVFPTHKGERGQPAIFAIKYRDELLALTGDTGAREIIKRHPEDTLPVAVDSDAVLIDIDDENSYREAVSRLDRK